MTKMMIKLKLVADIFLSAAWLTVIILGTVLREWMYVVLGVAFALLFMCFAWHDAVKLESMRCKYVIRVGEGTYYDGIGFTCIAKAKEYRNLKSVSKAVVKLIVEAQITTAPTVEMWSNRDEFDNYDSEYRG